MAASTNFLHNTKSAQFLQSSRSLGGMVNNKKVKSRKMKMDTFQDYFDLKNILLVEPWR